MTSWPVTGSGPARRAARAAGMIAVAAAAALGGGAFPAAASAGAGPGAPGDIGTVAGGVGGPAEAIHVNLGSGSFVPPTVTFAGGRVYIADGTSVRSLIPSSDWLTTPAGTGSAGPLGDGGLATRASLSGAYGSALDPRGNLVIADMRQSRIRVVAHSTGTFYGQAMTARHIYTVAGNGVPGYSGDGGPATAAMFSLPQGVAVDGAGNLLIADSENNRIRVVAVSSGTFYGQAMTAGDVYTVAGTGTAGYSGNGGPAAAAKLAFPDGVAVDGAGNVLIADAGNNRIRVVAVSSGTFYGQAMTAGDIYSVAGDGVRGHLGDGGPALRASLSDPASVTVDGGGNLLIADTGSNAIRVVAAADGTFYGQAMTAGDIYRIAGHYGRSKFGGDGGPALDAAFYDPLGVAVDGAGNVLIADSGHGRVRVVAAGTGTFYRQQMTAGDIYTIAGNGSAGSAPAPDGLAATAAQLDVPSGVAADGAGNVLLADRDHGLVRVVAHSTGTFYGRAMTAGDVYTLAGGGTHSPGAGLPATEARLNPAGVTVDAAGNVLIVEATQGGPGTSRVMVVAKATGTFYEQVMTAGDIYDVAGDGVAGYSGDGHLATQAEVSNPDSAALDAAGNVVIADTGNNRIRVVATRTGTYYGQAMMAGDIYTIAGRGIQAFSGDGGPALRAAINHPGGVAVDGSGNVLIADTANHRIRVVAESTGTFYGKAMTAGDIYEIAGSGGRGFGGDGGPALGAKLFEPEGVAVDGSGNLLIADTGNHRVRVVAETTGTFYGIAMTTGNIYTIAGDHAAGFSGDGGQATRAELDLPEGVAPDGSGVLIADAGNNRIRMVSG